MDENLLNLQIPLDQARILRGVVVQAGQQADEADRHEMGVGGSQGVRVMAIITLPWPDQILHPNARVYWATKARVAKAARAAAGWATRAAKVKVEGKGAITLRITFHPPDKRRRDLDGMLSSLKSAIDGIADALGVDDHRFRFTLEIGEPVKGGCVYVVVLSANGE